MSDQNSREECLKARNSWKRAFHLLKCIALRKFRIKFHQNLEKYQQELNKSIKVEKAPFQERIIYARPKLEPKKNYVSIIDLNDTLPLKKVVDRKNMKGDNLVIEENIGFQVDELAKSIISGILEEIKSSSSSRSSTTKQSDSLIQEIDFKSDLEDNISSDRDFSSPDFEALEEDLNKTPIPKVKLNKPLVDTSNQKEIKIKTRITKTKVYEPRIVKRDLKNKAKTKKSFLKIVLDKNQDYKHPSENKNSNLKPYLEPLIESHMEISDNLEMQTTKIKIKLPTAVDNFIDFSPEVSILNLNHSRIDSEKSESEEFEQEEIKPIVEIKIDKEEIIPKSPSPIIEKITKHEIKYKSPSPIIKEKSKAEFKEEKEETKVKSQIENRTRRNSTKFREFIERNISPIMFAARQLAKEKKEKEELFNTELINREEVKSIKSSESEAPLLFRLDLDLSSSSTQSFVFDLEPEIAEPKEIDTDQIKLNTPKPLVEEKETNREEEETEMSDGAESDPVPKEETSAQPEPEEEVVEKVSKKSSEAPVEKGKKKKQADPGMDPNFYYDYESLIFKPVISEESNLSNDLLQLFHSFGYDCKKRANLQLLDADTLIFSAGNLVQILNIKTKEQKYLKTISGGAVGAITVHPSREYFAVGEKGNVPNVNIFEYPSLKLYRVLRQGTLKGYAYLDYDPSGNLLASLGSAPDYMLTIWDWRQEKVVLRTKAFSQDIFKVTFSKDLKGILTSGGTGHIKFWKMASTFTGYKLQGDIGKFGKTEISDIEGYAELPDGKVLSGSEWGNMLLWDGGLIQTEICRKKNKSCHTGIIQQITLNEGDIYTIGDDGSIRVWDFETIDTAEPSEEGVKLEIEPLNELKVGNNVALRSMVKDFTEESTTWYAQDSNGGIWKLDLGFSASSENPKQLFNYHSGVINGIECCPISHLFATTADDGSVKIYNYLNYDILVQKKFNRSGTCLKWLNTNIDPEGGSIVAGFKDGVLRFLKLAPKTPNDQVNFDLILFEAFKPHTQAITHIAFDSKNSILATGSDDQTVFFFANKQNTRTPIGFVTLPSQVTYMTWTPADYAQNRLLVCMKNGAVYEFDAPVQGSYDTTKTFLIELTLKCRKYQFKSIKSRLRHEEELERKRKEEEERKKKEAEERRLRGIDDEEEKKKKKNKKRRRKERGKKENVENEENEEQAPKQDDWKPFIPDVPSKICWALYSSKDTFWLSMDDYDAGYLYECKFLDEAQKSRISAEKIDEPIRAVPVVKSDLTHSEDIPLTCMIFNKNKKYAIIGEKNGVLRINPMEDSKAIEDIKHYWSYGFHDNDYGHVTSISLSYDEKFLFSAGADSNIFGILFNSTQKDLENARKEKIQIQSKNAIKEAVDIDDPQAYSIEQAKQKSENDKMIAIAESKKQEMRLKINQLRKMFKDLTIKNDQLVPRLKLNKNEFMLEESIKEQVLNQISEKITLTNRELAWYAEKCRISLDKLQSKFRDVIDCDYIVVYTFDQTLNVSTFRTVALPKDMEQYKTELERQYLAKLLEKQKTKDNLDNSGGADSKSDADDYQLAGLSAADQMKKIFGKLRGNTAARVERALKKMDERRLKRFKRKKEWKELMSSRLPDNYENPDDLANIKYAEDNLGDFKLKTSDNYIVPENQRMNVFKAVERLMQIKQFIHDNQMNFNKKVKTLRDKKQNLVDEINSAINKYDRIQYLLGQKPQSVLLRPNMRPDEVPEKKYEYTREKLIEFKKEIESKSFQSKSHEEEGSGGLGGFSSNSTAASKDQSNSKQKSDQQSNQDPHAVYKQEGLKPLWHNKDLMSNMQKQLAQAKEIRLIFEQKQLIKSIEEKVKLFDAELKVLRHEKARIAIFMKNADLRHVTIFEEFLLLREFEKTENELELKLNNKKDEHLDMQSKLSDIQLRIDNKRKDIEKIDESLKQLMQTYTQMTHEEKQYGDFLSKVYKRKIKRKKKTEGAEDDDESEEESDDDDDDDEDLDNEDDDSEAEGKEQLDLDICPSGLRQELFDQVCQLREKRLDLEELHAEEKKALEQLKKDQDSLIKKGKIVENGLKQSQQELEDFQKEKQKKINSLDIVVTLRLSQIQFLNKNRLPSDLSEALAFDSQNLDRLQSRIKELQIEKAAEKKLFKNLRERHQELIRDKKKMDEYVGKLDDLCNKMMVDKFGKLVDLEKLELIAVNQQIEELKQKMAENENEHERVMQEWLSKINAEKDESTELLKANTTRTNEIYELLSESKRLETLLDGKQRSLGEEISSTTKKDIEERQRLHTLVQLQAQEVEALKAEIAILSRKGGHILPPTQPPALSQIQAN